jgi:hypothetical protein
VHEIKHDGFRFICRLDRGCVRVFSRRGTDYTERVPRIVDTLARLPAASATLDGEGVACDPNGVTNFDLLGGKATSTAKAAAARENGKRGGRPRTRKVRAARKLRLKRKAAAKASTPRKPARKASRSKPKAKSKAAAGLEWLRSQRRKAEATKRRQHRTKARA